LEANEMAIFQIISLAGDSRSLAFEALRCARKGDFDQAREKLEEARKSSVQVHQIQTKMLTEEAQGEKTEVSLLMVHAQDHLMTSMLARDLIEELVQMLEEKGGNDK